MFKSEVYTKRREELRKKQKSGIALFIGLSLIHISEPTRPY